MLEYIRTFWNEDFIDRKILWYDYAADYAAGATRYAAFHVTHADFLSCNVYAKDGLTCNVGYICT